MLAYAINEDYTHKINFGKAVLDKTLLYINPELWVKEKEHTGELKDPYKKVNVEFNQIQAYGRATGRMPENTVIARMLKKRAADELPKKDTSVKPAGDTVLG